MEIKRAPPAEGWEWLFLRIEMRVCIGGRHDYSIVIANEQLEEVAIGQHTALVIDPGRNDNARVSKA